MKVLLDTNVVLSWSLDRRSVRPEVEALLMDAGTTRLMSAVVPWEVAIKWRIGKLPLPVHPREWIETAVRRLVLTPLPVDQVHVIGVADLPDHHADPFDRLLIAQALVEGVPIVTADRNIPRYDVETVPAL
ncbi:MAG: type II toxin-antitoxin system VapC family toxin [Pseudonocardia sp.]